MILLKAGFGVNLELVNIGIQPDRLSQIKLITDII